MVLRLMIVRHSPSATERDAGALSAAAAIAWVWMRETPGLATLGAVVLVTLAWYLGREPRARS